MQRQQLHGKKSSNDNNDNDNNDNENIIKNKHNRLTELKHGSHATYSIFFQHEIQLSGAVGVRHRCDPNGGHYMPYQV